MSVFVGSYPTAPAGSDDLIPLAAELAEDPLVAGFEVPWAGSERTFAAVVAASAIRPSWMFMLTAIPWTMAALRASPSVGLASREEQGRRRAVAEHLTMFETARRLHDHLARRAVVAVQMHSAPRGGTAAALSRSCDDLEREIGDEQVLLEHVDAPVPGRAPTKGFLGLDAEAEVLAGRDARFGVALNWGRSAIELRDADRVVEHIAAARVASRLRLLVLSGVSDRASAYGPAWADAHLPPAGADEPDSLLTEERARAAIAAAGPDVLLGVKLAHLEADGRPPSGSRTVSMLRFAVALAAGVAAERYR